MRENEGGYPYGFRYLEDIFIYDKDVHGNIIGIKSQDGTRLVNYSFDENWILTGYVLTGEASGNPNADQIAEANSFLGIGCYYDRETGLYYNGRYYNTVTGTYMGSAGDDASVFTRERTEIMPQASVDYDMEADSWAQELLNSGTYGVQITEYSENWFENLSTIEILARLLYGENTSEARTPEREAIAWLLLYRMDSTEFGQGLRGIATASGQFSTINPVEDKAVNTYQARNPDYNALGWRNATYLACLLMLTTDKDNVYEVIGKPAYYTNQVFFISCSSAKSGLKGTEGVLTVAMVINNGRADVPVKDVVIIGVGNINSRVQFDNLSNSQTDNRNLFYNLK